MKRLISMMLAATTFSTATYAITNKEYSELFKNYKGCFILYSVNEHKILTEYNPKDRCNQRIPPDSTFKIPLSLIAFNQGVINQNTVFKWDGRQRKLPDWNQDLNPATWLKFSALWVSQVISPQIGYARMKHYLAGFDYGNQDFSGDPGKDNGLRRAWVNSSLTISAMEQMNFLKAMISNELPVSTDAVINTKKNMYQGKLANGADYYGKTGSGRHRLYRKSRHLSNLRDGWFVGFIENGAQQYVFVSNLTDKYEPESSDKTYGSAVLKPITLKLLNDYFSSASSQTTVNHIN